MRTISHVFTNTYMGYGHQTLRAIFEDALRENDLFRKQYQKQAGLVLFTNSAVSACKLMDPERNVIAYLKTTGSAIGEREIHSIAKAFGATAFSLVPQVMKALRIAVEESEARARA